MKRTAGELATFLGGRLEGNASEIIENLSALETAGRGDLSYAEPRFADRVPASGASCVLVAEGGFQTKTTIVVRNPKAAFARAASWLRPAPRPAAGIHPTAVIGEGVRLGDGVAVQAHAVVDAGVEIGQASVIGPGCHIGGGCRIGSECMIHSNVVVYAGTVVGDRVIVHAGAVLGSDGFGYVRDAGEYLKFPQIGGLVIEDEVEIGANTTIDRGSLGSTVIGRGTKLDNLCHIGHNVRIGSRTVIAAQVGVSGSCDIGSDVVMAGQIGVGDHARIDDGCVIGGQSGILNGKRARAGKILWGTPARPLEEIKLQQAYTARLPKMAKQLERLREQLDALEREKNS